MEDGSMSEGLGKKAGQTYRAHKTAALDRDEFPALAEKYLPIVKNEVLRFKMRLPKQVEVEDLQGAALSGLMRAVEKWEPCDEATFGAYVRQRVRGAILDELRRLDQMSRSVRKKARLYDETVRRIEQREGRVAGEEDIRRELGYSREAFADLLMELRPVSFLSFDEQYEDGRGPRYREELDDPNATSIPEKVESREMVELLRTRLQELPENERKILHMYYFRDFRLGEIAEAFGLSESRICQLHTHAIRGLRVYLGKRMEG